MHTQETIKVVPARYPLRAVGALLALLVLAVVIQSVAFNPRWEWRVFARWFFDPVILEGLGQTLLLTLLATALNGAIRSGDYAKVLNRWGEGVESIPQSEINPAGLGD